MIKLTNNLEKINQQNLDVKEIIFFQIFSIAIILIIEYIKKMLKLIRYLTDLKLRLIHII